VSNLRGKSIEKSFGENQSMVKRNLYLTFTLGPKAMICASALFLVVAYLSSKTLAVAVIPAPNSLSHESVCIALT
jgi:hypothetical protein